MSIRAVPCTIGCGGNVAGPSNPPGPCYPMTCPHTQLIKSQNVQKNSPEKSKAKKHKKNKQQKPKTTNVVQTQAGLQFSQKIEMT